MILSPGISLLASTYKHVNTKQQQEADSLSRLKNYAKQKEVEYTQTSEPLTYIVQRGDSLWKIAHEHGLTLDELREFNPQLKGKNLIFPNQELFLEAKPSSAKIVDIREQKIVESSKLSDKEKIQSVEHNKNYAIVDKANHTIEVYSPTHELLYTSKNINTGVSGNDYNTITKTDSKGRLLNMQGNNSTPAGITTISGIGTYHGYPSFQRSRNHTKTDNVASSIHWGGVNLSNSKQSNGCIRADGKTLHNLASYLTVGSKVYTLPEKEGSRFVLKDGKLSFIADVPYGDDSATKKDGTKNDKRFWDDYNTYIDKSYRPLLIETNETFANGLNTKLTHNDRMLYMQNVEQFMKALSDNKEKLQQDLQIDSDTYNTLAELALGIAQQESEFGTSVRYKLKNILSDESMSNIKKMVRGKDSARSRGVTQIKMEADNKDLRNLYKKYGLDKSTLNQNDVSNSALATMLRLIYMYKTEVAGRTFRANNDTELSLQEILCYKWLGKNNQLKTNNSSGKSSATPDENIYIQNVKEYMNRFNLKSVYA